MPKSDPKALVEAIDRKRISNALLAIASRLPVSDLTTLVDAAHAGHVAGLNRGKVAQLEAHYLMHDEVHAMVARMLPYDVDLITKELTRKLP